MFVIDKDGDYQPVNVSAQDKLQTGLPSGAYSVVCTMGGMYFQPFKPSGEPMIDLDLPARKYVAREIAEFFDDEKTARLAQAGIKHRRGIILHGPPGTGKTSMIRGLFPLFAKHNAVTIVDCNADWLQNGVIPVIRRNDPDRPIVLYFDEFDKNARHSHSELLMLLDGMGSPDHLLTIGCTNHIDRIPPQMRCRPSRFSLVLEVKELDARIRMHLVTSKYAMLDRQTQRFVVEITQKYPIDYLEEACKLALMGYDPDEIRDRINQTDPSALLVKQEEDDYFKASSSDDDE